MSDFTFNIPKLEVPLPSGGKTYKLNPDGTLLDKVMLKAMSAADENILHSPAYLQSGFAFTKVVQACITSHTTVDVSDMLIGDANTLLFMLRILSYGNMYSAQNVTCPSCQEKFEYDFDLNKDTKTKELEVEPSVLNENRFAFKLPQTGYDVEFKLETRNINNNIEIINKKLKKNHIEQAITTRLKNLIISVDHNEDPKYINAFVDQMPSGDSLALRNYMNFIAPTLELKQTIVCPECGEAVEVEIPLDYTFLYPNK